MNLDAKVEDKIKKLSKLPDAYLVETRMIGDEECKIYSVETVYFGIRPNGKGTGNYGSIRQVEKIILEQQAFAKKIAEKLKGKK